MIVREFRRVGWSQWWVIWRSRQPWTAHLRRERPGWLVPYTEAGAAELLETLMHERARIGGPPREQPTVTELVVAVVIVLAILAGCAYLMGFP